MTRDQIISEEPGRADYVDDQINKMIKAEVEDHDCKYQNNGRCACGAPQQT